MVRRCNHGQAFEFLDGHRGGLDIYSSTTGGTALTKRTNWASTSSTDFSHADIHYLGYNGTVLYCGSDGGVYKSQTTASPGRILNATLFDAPVPERGL